MAAPDWKGLFNWSMRNLDTQPPDPAAARALSEEDRRFLERAMEEYAQEPVKRMQAIQEQLRGDATEEGAVVKQEALLEELVEIVENIDFARDLAIIGGLPTLLRLLESPHPGVRARAAEVLATCAQANPPVQDWFLEGGVLQPLLKLASDPDDTCRTKALLALSCLVRHHPASLDAFRRAGGLRLLAAALGDGAPRARRKALQLLREVLCERPEDAAAACDLGLPNTLAALMARPSGETGEAALALLAALVADPAARERLRQEPRLLQALEAAETRLNSLDLADLEPRREELALARHSHREPRR
ncbi:hypothetical protein WJX81_001111 [Elliptochloris bilobata]|uniref:Nucleotide exchange factor Fes1 domain-containing protein n=1 Tax=Elliptochloris bilobata TaxID=381761 RepID=A0AAW1QTF4_9CHLO